MDQYALAVLALDRALVANLRAMTELETATALAPDDAELRMDVDVLLEGSRLTARALHTAVRRHHLRAT